MLPDCTPSFGIVDLVLEAARRCQFCRQGRRPSREEELEHGETFFHRRQGTPNQTDKCEADQLWSLIHKLEYR